MKFAITENNREKEEGTNEKVSSNLNEVLRTN